jgi:hypothetical protein
VPRIILSGVILAISLGTASYSLSATSKFHIRFSEIGSEGVGLPFHPLTLDKSVVEYGQLFAQVATYVLRVIDDADVDPDLFLHTSHIETGKALLEILRVECDRPELSAYLEQIRRLPNERTIREPPVFIAHGQIQDAVIPAVLQMQTALHNFLFQLVTEPRNDLARSTYQLPIHRFLALTSWNTRTKSFYLPYDMRVNMIQLQWSMRMTVFHGFQRKHRLGQHPPLKYVPSILE